MALACVLAVSAGAVGSWDPSLERDDPFPGPYPAHNADHRYTGPGPVHFPAGHVEPVSGIGVLAVVDTLFDPVGGYVCQSPPGDVPCLPSHPSLGGRVFCDGITLYVGNGWDPAQDLWVWLGSPFDTIGEGYGVTCEHPRPATTGYVFHFGPA